jgi:hypothetical protein
MNVKRGHCVIDRERCTIWVNDVDIFTLDPRFKNVHELQAWIDRHGADNLQPGLQKIWGGSDCDDMMRVFQFVDVADNNIRKCLVWRSPNKLGEFAVLTFQGGDDLPWAEAACGRRLTLAVAAARSVGGIMTPSLTTTQSSPPSIRSAFGQWRS